VTFTAAELERLIDAITDDLYERLGKPVRARRDEVCSDCTGTCAERCAFKMVDFLAAGAGRISAAPGTKKAGQVAALIDHTLLKPDATEAEIDKLCAEAAGFGFASVCVNPVWVARCAKALAGTPVMVCTVVGFPLGATFPEVKRAEALRAQELGAREVDMVIAIGLLKSGRPDEVERDIAAVTSACGRDTTVKVILETCLLTDEEKRQACRIAVRAGAHYVKTSTGFSTGGATVHDVALMRAEVGAAVGVKASGGVRDLATVEKMVAAGATRIGASAGVKIVNVSGSRAG
jgi:deoxyribose-phosphate aldolase